ncbi:MAG TPA: hypothetical protein VMW73_02985 [Spirochaetia bacterium]|nr:hypothetical protein [Spirochaetia bacterium]
MEPIERKLIHDWIATFLDQSAGEVGSIETKLMKCSDAHFRAADMEVVLAPFRGDLGGLITFLQSKWGWIIKHDRRHHIIEADENKPNCVCPLYLESIVSSPLLCECSRGFAARMFAYVIECEVQTEVIRSVIRDGQSCVYKVRY